MFADRGAAPRVALAVLLLAGLGAAYARWAITADRGWRWALEDPAARDGARMVFPLWEVTRIVSADRFEISKTVQDVPIAGDTSGLAVGDTISIDGHFDASGPVVQEEIRELHPLRPYKEALGFAGFFLVALWVPFAFRVQRGRVVERG
jgi:hypothetical protein